MSQSLPKWRRERCSWRLGQKPGSSQGQRPCRRPGCAEGCLGFSLYYMSWNTSWGTHGRTGTPEGRRDVASVAGSMGRWQPTGQLDSSVWVTGTLSASGAALEL